MAGYNPVYHVRDHLDEDNLRSTYAPAGEMFIEQLLDAVRGLVPALREQALRDAAVATTAVAASAGPSEQPPQDSLNNANNNERTERTTTPFPIFPIVKAATANLSYAGGPKGPPFGPCLVLIVFELTHAPVEDAP